MRVAIAEDAVLIREGLAALLAQDGFDICAEVGDARALLAAVAADPPDLVVTDIRMPPNQETEGLQAATAIKAEYPEVGVLILSQYVESHYALQLLQQHSRGIGYLLKDRIAHASDISAALHRIAAGESVIDAHVVTQLLGRPRADSPVGRLTAREHDVLELMAQGLTNIGIADRLVVSKKTVETHVRNIFLKLDLGTDIDEHRRVLAVLTYLRD